MSTDRFALLTERQRVCLRLVDEGYQNKQIATKLGIGLSTVNQRLGRARDAIGADNSRDAARLFRIYEQATGIWIPPTGSLNALSDSTAEAADDPDAAIGDAHRGDEIDDGQAGVFAPFPSNRTRGDLVIRWPFPSQGRADNDLNWNTRLGWTACVAALSLLALLGLIGLSVGVQDSIEGIQHGLARLH